MKTDSRTIVIVGGVAGGASAAARARRVNEHARIILIERDHYVSFANCGLPYYIGGEITDRNKLLIATPQRFADWFNIEVRTRNEAISIDRQAHSVRMLNRDTDEQYDLHYDRLILAPGAEPIIPGMPGIDALNVVTLRNLADTDRIKALVDDRRMRRAVVVGAGFIGLEMVEMLRRLDKQVTLVELQAQVLPPFDAEMAHIIQAELQRHGVDVRLGSALQSMTVEEPRATEYLDENGGPDTPARREGCVRSVTLADGSIIETDLVIIGIGVRPNTQLAADAGLVIGSSGGIAVNQHMQSSDPAVYAVGDACEYHHAVGDLTLRMPLAGPANRAGRVAGEHAATDTGPAMPSVMGTAIVRVFDLVAAVTGCNGRCIEQLGCDARSVWVPAQHHAGYYPGAQPMMLKLTYDPANRRALGAQIVGRQGVDKRIDVLATAIQLGASIDQLTELDLAYAPPFGSAKDPLHMVAYAAQNDLDDRDRFIAPTDTLNGDVQLLDVRTPAEWDAGHLDRAIHIPLDQLRKRMDELDRNKPVVTYCRGGQRSYFATRILRQHGFADVRTLAGGTTMRDHV